MIRLQELELVFGKTVMEVKSVEALLRYGISSQSTPILLHKIANQRKGVKVNINSAEHYH